MNNFKSTVVRKEYLNLKREICWPEITTQKDLFKQNLKQSCTFHLCKPAPPFALLCRYKTIRNKNVLLNCILPVLFLVDYQWRWLTSRKIRNKWAEGEKRTERNRNVRENSSFSRACVSIFIQNSNQLSTVGLASM